MSQVSQRTICLFHQKQLSEPQNPGKDCQIIKNMSSKHNYERLYSGKTSSRVLNTLKFLLTTERSDKT